MFLGHFNTTLEDFKVIYPDRASDCIKKIEFLDVLK